MRVRVNLPLQRQNYPSQRAICQSPPPRHQTPPVTAAQLATSPLALLCPVDQPTMRPKRTTRHPAHRRLLGTSLAYHSAFLGGPILAIALAVPKTLLPTLSNPQRMPRPAGPVSPKNLRANTASSTLSPRRHVARRTETSLSITRTRISETSSR
jgi:hypothetical protein